MKPSMAVTSSGFVFERRGDVVTLSCPPKLMPLAELEYLREVDPGIGPARAGRIVAVERAAAAGRAMHLVRIETGGGQRTISFDVGPAFVGRLRSVHEALGYVVYAMAAVTAMSGLVYALTILLD